MIESVGDGALDVPKTSLLNPSNPRSISNVYRRGGACSSHNLSAKSLFPAQHIHLTVGTTIGRPKTSLLHRPQRTVNDRPYNQRLIPSVGTFLAGDGSSLSPSVTPLLRRDPPSLRLLSNVYHWTPVTLKSAPLRDAEKSVLSVLGVLAIGLIPVTDRRRVIIRRWGRQLLVRILPQRVFLFMEGLIIGI